MDIISIYLVKAKSLLESQMNLLTLSLQYPNTFVPKSTQTLVSPFLWSPKFTKRDLIEIIVALDHLGAVENKTGGRATYRSIVTAFELMFNVNLSKSYNKREEVLNRKIKTTDFLSKMQEAIIERSQK